VLYRIYKLEPKARVCISDTTRTRIVNGLNCIWRIVNGLKNDSSYEFIVEVILKIKVYVNQHESVSHIQTPSRP
jgi:hypothetical protein